jgi:Fibronectin type III domain
MRAAPIERFRILIVMLCLLVASRPGLAQLPDRTRGIAPSPADPTLEPPLPTEPRVSIDPTVQPGILIEKKRPVLMAEPEYLVPGDPPTQVQVGATGPRSVTLTWQPVANAMGYRVYLARQGETSYSGGGLETAATATASSLLPATAYSFKVSAVYAPELKLREGVSAPVSATTSPAAAPSGLKASAAGQGRVSVSWDALPGSDGFRLFRNGSPIAEIKRDTSTPISPFGQSPYAQAPPLATTFADSVGVGTHRYSIQAVYKSGGAEVVSALAPTPPVSVTIEASTRVKYCQ